MIPAHRTRTLARRLGARLIAARGQRRQQHVAAAAGLSKAYLSQLEGGKRVPTLFALDALAKALHVPLGELLNAIG